MARASLCGITLCALALLVSRHAEAAYSNYNSVLLGERASGMAGAFTALSDDASATPFYNPAATILMKGHHLSTAVSVYNKFVTTIGESADFADAPQRLNRGFFQSLPSSSGTVLSFDSFAIGLSILVPDLNSYSGQVKGSSETVSFLSLVDESLWVGGTFALKLTSVDSAGLSIYYTARNLSRTVNDRTTTASAAGATLINEEKELTTNSIVPIFGYHRRLNETWTFGISYRPPSLPISGDATYYRATTATTPYSTTVINRGNLRAITKIPAKLAVGVAREVVGVNTISLDLQFYEGLSYNDLPELPEGTEQIEHRSIMNFAIGYEQVLKPWLKARFGYFSNLSSHPDPKPDSPYRQGSHVDMQGFAANLSLQRHEGTTFTIGGYYDGGRGQSTELVGGAIAIVPKSEQVFTMLIASGFVF